MFTFPLYQSLPLQDNPRVFFAGKSLQNSIIQTNNMVDRPGQNFVSAIQEVARKNGSVQTDFSTTATSINMECGVTASDTHDFVKFRNEIESFKKYIDGDSRHLRVMHLGSYIMLEAPTSSTVGRTGVTAVKTTEPQIISHNYSVGASGYTTQFASVDLSNTGLLSFNDDFETPVFEFSVGISDYLEFDHFKFEVGNNDSNKYVWNSVNTTYENTTVKNGFNIISIPIFETDKTFVDRSFTYDSQVGVVDQTDIKWAKITAFDLEGNEISFEYGGLWFAHDVKMRNFVVSPDGAVSIPQSMNNRVSTKPSFDFVCPDGYAKLTHPITVARFNSTDITQDFQISLLGNKLQLPIMTIILNNVTNLSKIRLKNLTTQTSVEFDEGGISWAANDKIVFDSVKETFTRNGANQSTSGGLIPEFDFGVNKMQLEVIQSNDVNIDTNANTASDSEIVGAGDNIAQSFTTTSAGVITEVKVKAKMVNGLSSQSVIFAEIQTDSAGVPSGTAVGAFGVTDILTSTSGEELTFDFASESFPATVTNATKYWVVFSKTGNDFRLQGSAANPYAGGECKIDTTGSYVASVIDDADMQIKIAPIPSIDYDLRLSYTPTYQ